MAVVAAALAVGAVVVGVDHSGSSVPVIARPPSDAGTSAMSTTTVAAVVGGACAGQPPGCDTRSGSAVALAHGSWSPLRAGPLSARLGEVSVWTGRSLILWGGATTSAGKSRNVDDGAAYDPSTRTWAKLPRSPLSARVDASAVWDGTAMLVWGGITHFDPSNNTDQLASNGAAYNPTTRTWTALPSGPLAATDSATMLWTGTEAVIFGGVTAGDKGSTQGAAYQPATGEWTRLPAFPKPALGKPIGTSAAWTGHDLIIVETYERIRTFHESISFYGSRVAAAWREGSSRWERLPTAPKQAAFYLATGVWTGRQVLQVGGTYCLPGMSCPSQLSSEMGAYVPATRRWVSLPGSPVVGPGDPIVWTGRAVVFLAGFTPTTAQVYDSHRAIWYKLPRNPNAAFGENGALAAWTGKQLLVLTSRYTRRDQVTTAEFYALTPRTRR
jgi:hypothetical protein